MNEPQTPKSDVESGWRPAAVPSYSPVPPAAPPPASPLERIKAAIPLEQIKAAIPVEQIKAAIPLEQIEASLPREQIASARAAVTDPARPELAVGAAFAGGFLVALILKLLAR